MAFGKEQIKNIALELLKDLLGGSSKSSGGGRPNPPPGRAHRPYYTVECWMGDVDLSLRLHKILLINSIMSVYPVFFLEFMIDDKDYSTEKIYGQDTMTLHIALTSEDNTPIEDNKFELLVVDIKTPMSTKPGETNPSQPTENIIKMIALIKQPFTMMTTPVNMIIEPKASGTGSQKKSSSGTFGQSSRSSASGLTDAFGNGMSGSMGQLFNGSDNLLKNFTTTLQKFQTLGGTMDEFMPAMTDLLNTSTGVVPDDILTQINNAFDSADAFNDAHTNLHTQATSMYTVSSDINTVTKKLNSGQIDIAGNPANIFNSLEQVRDKFESREELNDSFTTQSSNLAVNAVELKNLIFDISGSIRLSIDHGDETDYTESLTKLEIAQNLVTTVNSDTSHLTVSALRSGASFNEFTVIAKDTQLKASDISYNIPDFSPSPPTIDLEYRKKLEAQQKVLNSVTNSLGSTNINKFSTPLLMSEIIKVDPLKQVGSNADDVIGSFTSNSGNGSGFAGLGSGNLNFQNIFSGPTSLFGSGMSGNNPFASISSNSQSTGTSGNSEKTPFDYAQQIVEKFLKNSNNNLVKQNNNEDKLEQITIPPRTFCGAIRYLNNMYSIFKGPMFSYCRWENNTYCLWDLSKAINNPEDYTIEFLAVGEDSNNIYQKAKQDNTLYFTYNPINIVNRGNKNIAAHSHSQIFVKKDLHQFVNIVESNVDDLSDESAADTQKQITYNDAFKDRKRIYSRGVTGGPKQSDDGQLKNKIINYISSSSRIWFELSGYNIPITKLSRIGGSIKLNPHVPDYIPYGGKYVVSGSVIKIHRDESMTYKAGVLVYAFRANVEST